MITKKIALSLVMLFSSQFVVAASVECSSDALIKKTVHNLPGAGYWMQAAGDCRITYTAVGGVFSQMYNLCTRKSEKITNIIDAFALPDGDIYVHPFKGISFFKMSDALTSGALAKPFFSDPQHIGNYESIGILPGATDQLKIVRIAMGNASGATRDYKLEKKGTDDFEVTPLGDNRTKVCQNLEHRGLDYEVPVISRDGQMIAGRESGSRKMGVYKLEMPSGNCELITLIPTVTSKVSFSFNNKDVFYVIQDPQTRKGRLMKINLDTKVVKTLSGPDEDVMYVTTRKDGSVFYSRRSADRSYNSPSDLVEMDSKSVADIDKPVPYEAIGMMWADACGKDLDLDTAQLVGQRLGQKDCNSLITNNNISKLDDNHKKVTSAQLKAICSDRSSSVGTRVEKDQPATQQ